MKIRKAKCRVCEKELETFYKHHMISKSYPEYKNPMALKYKKKNSWTYWDSKDGVLFHTSWFCNSCWKKIISKVNFKD